MKIIWRIVRTSLAVVGAAVVAIFVTEANWATRPSKKERQLHEKADAEALQKLRLHYLSEHGNYFPASITLMEAESEHMRDHLAWADPKHDLSSLAYRPERAPWMVDP